MAEAYIYFSGFANRVGNGAAEIGRAIEKGELREED